MPSPSFVQILLGLCVSFYALVIVGLVAGLRRLNAPKSDNRPFVSVIVAARNEENNIDNLLNCLTHQDYPHFEVIVVNDRSTDGTAELVAQFRSNHPNLLSISVLSPDSTMPAKKNALAQGIAGSRGEILCFTDADCLPPAGWITALIAAFDDSTGLVAGYSPYSARSDRQKKASLASRFLSAFTEYEEFKGAVWAAGSIGWRIGWLCTGRSLAYRRRVYDEVGGFEKIKQSVSGDDDLFLQLVRRETRWNIRYVTDPRSFVSTYPPSDMKQFIQQRLRHFSAGKFFRLPLKAFFLCFHTSNLLIVLSLILSVIFQPEHVYLWPYVAKCLFDALAFFSAARTFGQLRFSLSFPVFELLYVGYNTVIGPLGFIKRFEWKPGQ
jgi:cellulose synthase/poly-beta-1,6-N-acetylglucosamine synthase-like glycosyltransferase